MSYLEELIKGAAESYKGAVGSVINLVSNAASQIKEAVTYTKKETTNEPTQVSLPKLLSQASQQIKTSGFKGIKDESALGIVKNTITGLPKAAVEFIPNVAKSIYEGQVRPSPEQKAYEAQILPYTPETSPIARMTTAPGVFAARQISRFINPGLQPLATGLADIYEVQRPGGFADQVAEGKLPTSYLDELAVLNKTAPQIVGDVAQAVLSAYAGGQAEKALVQGSKMAAREAIKTGAESGLKVGTAFGTAQAASSGSDNPLEIAGMIGTSAGAGGLLAAITSGAIPVSKEVLAKVKEVAKQHSDMVTKYGGEGGFIKNPLAKKQAFTPDEIQLQAENYVKEQVAKREKAREVEGKPNFVSNLYNEFKKTIVDFTYPIEDAVRLAQKRSGIKYSDIELSPLEKVKDGIDMALRAPTLAGKFMEDKGLKQVIQTVDNLDNLDQYLVAKQSIDVDTRGIETGRDLQKDIALVKTFAPKYEQFAQIVNQYSKDLLDYAVQSGLISEELAKKLKETYPNYVPMNRVFNELEKPNSSFGNKGVANLSSQTIVKTLKGSTREVESPFASLLQKTKDAFTQGEKNKAAQVLTEFANTPEGESMGIRKLKPGETPASGEDKITLFRNGIKEEYSAPKAIAEAAKNLNSQQMNILGKIFSYPTRIAKIGITGINLPFVGANIIKDQVGAFINSNNAFKTSVANPSVFVKALLEAVKHGPLYDELVRQGAGGTSFDIARDVAIESVEKIRAGKDLASKALYTVKNPSELLNAVEGIVGRSEEFTRLQQYAGTKQAYLEKGATPEVAQVKARIAARENTVNFSRRGEWGQVLNSAFLYLNAGIQGSRLIVKNIQEKPIATSAKIATAMLFPTAMFTAWNLSDPKREEAYRDIQEYEKDGNFIIIPPNPTKDDKGRWNVIKIPMAPGYKALTVPVRKAIESTKDISEVALGDIGKALFGTVSPVGTSQGELISAVLPQAFKPIVESYANKNFFTGLPIVPDSMKNLSPEMQARPYTSGTARKIAKIGDWSPIKVEEFVKGTFGGVGSQALNVSDRALAGLDIIPESQIGGQDLVEAILARFSKARGGAIDNKTTEKIKELLTNQADKNLRLKQGAEVLYEELNALPKKEANARAQELRKENPQMFNELKSIIQAKDKGLDYNDRLILQLQVTNGERAKFIKAELDSLKTKAEKQKYAAELQKKGILTKNVISQINQLSASK